MISIQIHQIKSPGHFFCREIDSDTSSAEYQLYQQLHYEINETFNKEQIVHVPYSPKTGEICIGFRLSDKTWYRVRNEGIFTRRLGQEANCYFVDVGGTEPISTQWLRKSPRRFLDLPFQIKECCLYGVKALTLAIQEDLSLAEKSCIKWDDSATSFMEKCVARAFSCSAEIICADVTGRIHIKLYLNNGRELYNFNNLLVTNKYAVVDEVNEPVITGSGKNTISRNNKHLNKLLAESFSDSEITNLLKMPISGACSDRGEYQSSAKGHNTGNLSETDYSGRDTVRFKDVQYQRKLEQQTKFDTGEYQSSATGHNTGNLSETDYSDRDTVRFKDVQNQRKLEQKTKFDVGEYQSLAAGHNTGNLSETDYSDRDTVRFKDVQNQRKLEQKTKTVENSNFSQNLVKNSNLVEENVKFYANTFLPEKTNISDTEINFHKTENYGTGSINMHNSYSDTESVAKRQSLPWTSFRGRVLTLDNCSTEMSPAASSASVSNRSPPMSSLLATVSRGRSTLVATLPASVSTGTCRAPPVSSLSASFSRGRLSQLEHLKLAMNSKLPPSSSSSISDLDSDIGRRSPDVQKNFRQSALSSAFQCSSTEFGARPKEYSDAVPGQFDDSESDSSKVVQKTKSISVDSLLRNDPNVSITRGRLPKAAMSKVGMTSGSETDSSRNLASRNVNQSTISSDSDSDHHRNQATFLGHVTSPPRQSEMSRQASQTGKPSVRFSDDLSCSSETDSSSTKTKTPSPVKMTEEEKRRSDMISKLQGNQLLSILKPGNNSSGVFGVLVGSKNAEIKRMDNLDHCLVHSADRIKPITKYEDAPIGKLLKEAFRKKDFPAPKLIQAYAWKSILRGINFVGLSPPDSGKTLAYLVPVLSQLLHPGPYKNLKGAQGPLAVFLVPSWKKVQSLYKATCEMLQGETKIRVIDLFGSEELKMIPLISGCEILISTPPCLKRVLERQYVQLNRLCHLVVDDAEVTLLDYVDEIQHIVSNYSVELRKQDDRTAPQQLMLFGTQWEPVVYSFVKEYMPEPIIAITSRYEASLYGKVRQIPLMCKSVQKPNVLLEKMDDLWTDNCRLIIFASTVSLAQHVHQLIKSLSLFALLAHDDMDKFDIHEKSSSWHCSNEEEPIILITTDLSIPHLYISNATTIVHYDLPDSKTKFGNRMSCMSAHYWNYLNRDQEQKIVPTSYLMITEECGDKVDTISQLLVRSKVTLPVQLKAMMAGRRQKKNSDEEKKLCTYMKAYGKCRHEEKCRNRHLVIPEIDSGSNFTCGYVKVRITNIDSASHFHGIIMEHKAPDGTVTDFKCNYTELLFKMAAHYGNVHNRMRHTNMCIGDLCAYELNDTFHRVKILEILNLNSTDDVIKADVKFVDDGMVERVPAKQLYDLPQKLKAVPFQTVDIFICRVRPVDKDQDWTPRANMFMHDLIQRKELDGRIVLSMDNTIWLDPLVELVELTAIQTFGRKMNVRMELLSNGFAVDNPTHLQDLYEACKGKIRVPDINKEIHKSEKALTVDILPASHHFHDVYISAIDLPNLFFVQRRESHDKLEKMMDNLNAAMDREDIVPFTEDEVEACVCVAKFPDDDRWYRVKVISDLKDGNVEVFYGDYGDKRSISKEELFQLPASFTEFPFQAIECELANVQPRGDNWEDESGDLFWDLTHMVCDDKKCIVAKIIAKDNSVYTGTHRYQVELFDTQTSDDINIGQELVWSSLASPKPDSSLQELFMLPQSGRKTYKSSVQKIPDLCGIIYWEKNTEKARAAPKDIYTIVEKNVKSAPLDLIGYKALASIIKLIGRISHPESHQWMLESLFCAAKYERLREELIEQDCGIGVTKCLEQNCRPDIQEQAVVAIDKFLEISHSFVEVFGDKSTIEILCQLLDVSERNTTLLEIYRTLSSLCAVSNKICEFVHNFNVCTTVQKHLEKSEHHEIEEAALKYLVKLMERNAEQLRKDKLIKAVVAVLERSQSDKCIEYGVKLCENYCQKSTKSKDEEDKKLKASKQKTEADNEDQKKLKPNKSKRVLLEFGLAVTLTKIMKSVEISTDTKRSCQALYESLVVKVPVTTSLTNRPINQQQEVTNSVLPPVHWVQNTFRVIISIKVKGVNTCDVNYTSKTIDFKTKIDGKLYQIYYELYDEINPSKCQHEVRSGEVRISLRKVEKGQWPRLLRQKQKPSNLSVDFERFVDSSSDSEVCDDDKPFVLKKSKKKQLPGNMKRPKKVETGEDNFHDNSSDESSSITDEEVLHRTSADYDPYDPFS